MPRVPTLVVEDDPVLRHAIERAMGSAGYDTRAAETCATALASALETMPRLLVLDLSLPDGNGLDLLEEIRRVRPDGDIAVVVVSSDRVSRAELRAHRVDRFIAKPVDMGYLVDTAGDVLSGA
jgi:DNA-binding response OmpR family regulator